jgi:hypothetical protein
LPPKNSADSETTAVLSSNSANAPSDACGTETRASHGRARQSSAALVSPSHWRNSEILASSVRKNALGRARLNVTAISSAVSTTVKTLRFEQRSG